MTRSFTDHTHIGCVKTLAISSKGVLASGSTDETIQLLNLRKRIEMGSLVHHQGSVTDLSFHGGIHLFSTSDDATLCIWKHGKWECLRTLKGHKAGITSVAVHPTGKLALTVAQDKTLRTWNLINGRPAFISCTPHVADCVRWSLSGDHYAVLYPNTIEIYNTESASVCCNIVSKPAINCIVFLKNVILAYSIEGGLIKFHDVSLNKDLGSLNNETKRVKCMVCEESPDTKAMWLVAGSSCGCIKVWALNFLDPQKSELVTKIETGFRITCLAAATQRILVREEKQSESGNSESSAEEDVHSADDWSDGDEVINIGKVPPKREEHLNNPSKKDIQKSVVKKPINQKRSLSPPVKTTDKVRTVTKKSRPEHALVYNCNATTKFIVTENKR